MSKGKASPPRTGFHCISAERTGLEPAASGVTGRRYNQLNYRSRIADDSSSDRAVFRHSVRRGHG